MKDTKKQPFLTALRHALTLTGGIAIAHGYATQSQVTELAGLIPVLAGPLWDMADEWLAARKVDDDARLNAAVASAVAAALAAQKFQISETKFQTVPPSTAQPVQP